MKRAAYVIAVLLVLAMVGGWVYQSLAEARDDTLHSHVLHKLNDIEAKSRA